MWGSFSSITDYEFSKVFKERKYEKILFRLCSLNYFFFFINSFSYPKFQSVINSCNYFMSTRKRTSNYATYIAIRLRKILQTTQTFRSIHLIYSKNLQQNYVCIPLTVTFVSFLVSNCHRQTRQLFSVSVISTTAKHSNANKWIRRNCFQLVIFFSPSQF